MSAKRAKEQALYSAQAGERPGKQIKKFVDEEMDEILQGRISDTSVKRAVSNAIRHAKDAGYSMPKSKKERSSNYGRKSRAEKRSE